MEENKQGLMVNEKIVETLPVTESGHNGNGNHVPIETKQLPVSKQVSSEQIIAEENLLFEK
ncbi:MAG TPA: hypothetical protein VGD05_00920, partial [Pyrinomonadaceae bacterium]